MAVLLGLAAALAYGLSDFVAGLISRRVSFVLVAVIGHIVACVLTVTVVLLATPVAPSPAALSWGAASGVGSGFGTLALYRGLGRGRMSVVAPLSALGAAILPAMFGVVLGERPTVAAWGGIALALPAIWFVSRLDPVDAATGEGAGSPAALTVEQATPPPRLAAGVLDGLLAGLGFALLFVALDLAGDASGLWPVAAGQVTSAMLLTGFAVVRLDRGHRPARRVVLAAVATGVLGAAATILYFLSTQAGLLAIVAVLTSLYPAVTVLLAALMLREPVTRSQGLGLALAGSAVALIVLG